MYMYVYIYIHLVYREREREKERAVLLSLPSGRWSPACLIMKKHLQSAWSVIFPLWPHCCLRPGTGDHPNGARLRLLPESAHIQCWWPRQLRQMGGVCKSEQIQSRNHKKRLIVMESWSILWFVSHTKGKVLYWGSAFTFDIPTVYINILVHHRFDLVSSFIRVFLKAEIELWR